MDIFGWPFHRQQRAAFAHGDAHGHRAFVSCNIVNEQGEPVFAYSSFPDWETFYTWMVSMVGERDRTFYEIVRPHVPRKLHFDLDARRSETAKFRNAQDGMARLIGAVKTVLRRRGVDDAGPVVLESHKPDKFSVHLVFQTWAGDHEDQARLVAEVRREYGAESADQDVVDWGIYSRNRAMRLPLNRKPGGPALIFPSVVDADLDIWRQGVLTDGAWEYARDVLGVERLVPVPESDPAPARREGEPEAKRARGGNSWDTPELRAAANEICLRNDLNGQLRAGNIAYTYYISAPRGQRYCILAERKHRGNQGLLIWRSESREFVYKCLSQACRGRERVFPQGGGEQPSSDDESSSESSSSSSSEPPPERRPPRHGPYFVHVEDRQVRQQPPIMLIPFDQWAQTVRAAVSEVRKKKKARKAYAIVRRLIIPEMNRYFAGIRGKGVPYVLYKEFDYHQHPDGSLKPLPFWQAKQVRNFKEVFKRYRIPYAGKPFTDVWYDSQCAHWFAGECFTPPREVPKVGYFNTFTPLAISSSDARAHRRPGHMDGIRRFIREAWCAGERNPDEVADWVWNWFAHQVQQPGQKLKTAVVLRGPEGTGKSFFFTKFGEILGRTHFTAPTDVESIVGFNAQLDGALFVFMDEVEWRGQRFSAEGVLKKLMSEDYVVIDEKFQPKRRVENRFCMGFSSNKDFVIPAGAHARRWCVLECNAGAKRRLEEEGVWADRYIYGDVYDLAHQLYQHPIPADFNPHECPKTRGLWLQKLQQMHRVHKWYRQLIVNEQFAFGQMNSKEELYAHFMAEVPSYRGQREGFWRKLREVIKPAHGNVQENKRQGTIMLPPLRNSVETAKDIFNRYYGGEDMFLD